MQEKFLSYDEAAELLGTTRGTLQTQKWAGTLPFPYYPRGRRILFKGSELIAYMNAQKQEPSVTKGR